MPPPPAKAPPSVAAEPCPYRWFAEEVQPHDSSLKAYLRASFPVARDLDDVVQESYLRLWRIRAERRIRSAKAFLFQIARHVAIDRLRRERAAPFVPHSDLSALAVPDPGLDAADHACSHEELTLLAEAIAELPPRCREVVLLRKIHRLSQKEIARRLGLSEQTVQAHVWQGVKRCERFLAARGALPSSTDALRR